MATMAIMKVVQRQVLVKVAIVILAAMVMMGVDAQDLADQFLQPQNAAREQVGVAALVWNPNLQAYAESYAATMGGAGGACQLVHSGGPYGENLFLGGAGRAWTPADAVALWVDEQRYYDYASNTCTGAPTCGHYTQVVWRATTDVGCASQICSDGATFIICSYSPPGNVVGQRPY